MCAKKYFPDYNRFQLNNNKNYFVFEKFSLKSFPLKFLKNDHAVSLSICVKKINQELTNNFKKKIQKIAGVSTFKSYIGIVIALAVLVLGCVSYVAIVLFYNLITSSRVS